MLVEDCWLYILCCSRSLFTGLVIHNLIYRFGEASISVYAEKDQSNQPVKKHIMAQRLLSSLARLTNDESMDPAVQSEQLAELFTPHLLNPSIAALQGSIQNWSDEQVTKAVEQAQLFDGGWGGFEQFVSSI